MIAHFNRYRLMLRMAIYTLPLASFPLACCLHSHWTGVPVNLQSPEHLYPALLTTMAWSIVAEMEQVTSITKISAENTGVLACFAACGITYAADVIALSIVNASESSRARILVNAFILMVLSVVLRTVFRIMLSKRAGRGQKIRVMILGTSCLAARAARRVQHNECLPCDVVGYVQLPGEEVCVSGAPVFQLSDIERIESSELDDFLFAAPPERYGDARRCMAKLKILGKPLRMILSTGSRIDVRDRIVQFGGIQVLDLDPSPTSSLAYSLGKRGFDIAFSTMVLITCAVPMVIIGTVIKLTSPGPVLFRQNRVGKNGKLFTMYKFRTMRVAPASEGETRWTAEGDPRRTQFGVFLRKTSLDELPQFFNVLKGEMSVVGPRPERPVFVRRFREDISLYQERHYLNVGITGWAQVNGLRGDTSIQRRVRYDLYYLQHWSLLFDVRIILMTIFGGFMGKNAY